jgi:N-acetylglucosaminyldiphosphoundecaprenol N-acetyl-beta-D-mannosaminyltransferase
MMGCVIDNLTMEETLERIEYFVQSGVPHQHAVINVDKVVKVQGNPVLRQIINDCALVNVDGMPVVWASRLLGTPLKERITGVDLFERLVMRGIERKWRIFLLGASEDVVTRVRRIYETKYPDILICGHHNGYWPADREAEVVRQIKQARPDLLFVAISSPKKEQFLACYQKYMEVPFAMGVGGAFDVVAGKVRRAPLWMQRHGLEWFYRFAQEPRRMFRRYFIEAPAFLWILAKEIVRTRNDKA